MQSDSQFGLVQPRGAGFADVHPRLESARRAESSLTRTQTAYANLPVEGGCGDDAAAEVTTAGSMRTLLSPPPTRIVETHG